MKAKKSLSRRHPAAEEIKDRRDPVCGMVLEKETEFKVDHQNQQYFFCSERCKDYFLQDPKKYLSETPLVELRGVAKIFPLSKGVEVPALKRVDLKIFKGDFIAIIGPSGSGKSTLMNIIGLLDTPTKGEVLFEGKNIAQFSEYELARLRSQTIGFVFQQFNLLPHLTVIENVTLPCAFTQNLEGHLQAEKVLTQVGLLERKTHRPNQLSGGEQQRIAIARALINNAEILIADEPTGNLDSKTGELVMELLEDLNRQGRTLVVVTHDPGIASRAEKIFQLKDGIIQPNHFAGRQFLWQTNANSNDK